MKIIKVSEELTVRLEKVEYELLGYMALIKEFTVDVPGDSELTLDEVHYNEILDRYNKLVLEQHLLYSAIIKEPFSQAKVNYRTGEVEYE